MLLKIPYISVNTNIQLMFKKEGKTQHVMFGLLFFTTCCFFIDVDIREYYKEAADKILVPPHVLANETLKCCHIRSLLLMTKMTLRA